MQILKVHSANLRNARNRLGYSIRDLATRVNELSENDISGIEGGIIKNIPLHQIEELAAALEVNSIVLVQEGGKAQIEFSFY